MSGAVELTALLTRAATVEAQRQAAEQRGDRLALEGLTLELADLQRRHAALAAAQQVA